MTESSNNTPTTALEGSYFMYENYEVEEGEEPTATFQPERSEIEMEKFHESHEPRTEGEEEEDTSNFSHQHYSGPKLLAYFSLIFLLFGTAASAVIFILDSTDRDVTSLIFTSFLWPVYNVFFLVMFVVSGNTYIKRIPRREEDRAMFFYPRYQWDVNGGITAICFLLVLAFVMIGCVVPQVGLSFEPTNTNIADSDTDLYNNLHILLAVVSIIIFYIICDIIIVFMGKIYPVKEIKEIKEAIQPHQQNNK